MYCFAKLCRLCLTSVNTAVTLTSADGYNVTLFYKLMNLFPDLVSPNDNLPMHICSECLRKLNISYQFQVQCIEAHKKLKNYLFQLQNTSSNISHSLNEANVNIKTEVEDPKYLENFAATDTNTNTLKHLFIKSQKRESCDYKTDNDLHSEISSNFRSTVKVEIDNEETIAAQNIDQSNELERGNSDISEPVRREVSLENPNLNLNQEKSDNISEVEDSTTSHITSETHTNLHHETRFSFSKEFQESKPDINIFSCRINVIIDDKETVAAQNGKNNESNALESAGTDISGSLTREHRPRNLNFDSNTEESDYSSDDDQSFYPSEAGSSDEDYNSDEEFKGCCRKKTVETKRISSSELTNENIPHLSNAVTETDPNERETEKLMYNNSRGNQVHSTVPFDVNQSVIGYNNTRDKNNVPVNPEQFYTEQKNNCKNIFVQQAVVKSVKETLRENTDASGTEDTSKRKANQDEPTQNANLEDGSVSKRRLITESRMENCNNREGKLALVEGNIEDEASRKENNSDEAKNEGISSENSGNDEEALLANKTVRKEGSTVETESAEADKDSRQLNTKEYYLGSNDFMVYTEEIPKYHVFFVRNPPLNIFYCKNCKIDFPTSDSLSGHIRGHFLSMMKKEYKCTIYSARVFNNELTQHMAKHPPKNSTASNNSNAKSNTKRAYTVMVFDNERYKCVRVQGSANEYILEDSKNPENKVTFVKDDEEDIFSCKKCRKLFSSYATLRWHLFIHVGEKKYKCPQCDYHSRKKSNIDAHMRTTHSRELRFACDICGKKFKAKENLKVHKRNHSKEYMCDICGLKLANSGRLNRHKLVHSDERNFKCSECEFATKSAEGLKKHMVCHDKTKEKHKCDKCSKLFSSVSALNLHMLMHDESNRKFECRLCDKKFFVLSRLQAHERKHTGEKPFKCEHCGKGFRMYAAWQNHLRTHTGEKPFKCDVCKKCFAQQTALQVHKRIHTGERPYKCANCGQTFVQSYTHSQHVKKKKCQKKRDADDS